MGFNAAFKGLMHAHGVGNNYCILEINVPNDSSLGIGLYFPIYLFVC